MLLARDLQGYGNLCGLLTLAHAKHEKGTAGITVAQVAAAAAGLTAIVPLEARRDPEAPLDEVLGPSPRPSRSASSPRRGATATAATPPAPPPRWPPRAAMDSASSPRRARSTTTRRAGPSPTSSAASGSRPRSIRRGRGSPPTPKLASAPARRCSLFGDHPAWVHDTAAIAEEHPFSLGELEYHFPSDTLCLPGEAPDRALRRLVEVGCRDRYPEGTPAKVTEQIERELEIIAHINVAPYFLSVQQIVGMAREKRILCQGRGSAANSAVCFVLGITAVDPARNKLLFERFLAKERAEPPDIDVDFEHERREEIIQAIYATYGRERAAMVSEIISYRAKSALREVGKAFGLAIDQVDRLSGLVVHMDPGHMSSERIAEAGLDPADPRLMRVLDLAQELRGSRATYPFTSAASSSPRAL